MLGCCYCYRSMAVEKSDIFYSRYYINLAPSNVFLFKNYRKWTLVVAIFSPKIMRMGVFELLNNK